MQKSNSRPKLRALQLLYLHHPCFRFTEKQALQDRVFTLEKPRAGDRDCRRCVGPYTWRIRDWKRGQMSLGHGWNMSGEAGCGAVDVAESNYSEMRREV